MQSELSQAIKQLVQERGIPEELVMSTIENFLLAAYKKKYGVVDNAVVRFSDDSLEVTLFAKKKIVLDDDLDDPVEQLGKACCWCTGPGHADRCSLRAELADHISRICEQRGDGPVVMESMKVMTRLMMMMMAIYGAMTQLNTPLPPPEGTTQAATTWR